MYPRDAITISFSTKTAGNYTFLPASNTPYTILSGTMSGTGAGGDEQFFILGTSSIALKGDTAQQVFLNLVYVNTPLRIVKTGSATTTFGITYVPRNRNTTLDPQTEVQATSTVSMATGTNIVVNEQINALSYIYAILVTVGLLVYIFKK